MFNQPSRFWSLTACKNREGRCRIFIMWMVSMCTQMYWRVVHSFNWENANSGVLNIYTAEDVQLAVMHAWNMFSQLRPPSSCVYLDTPDFPPLFFHAVSIQNLSVGRPGNQTSLTTLSMLLQYIGIFCWGACGVCQVAVKSSKSVHYTCAFDRFTKVIKFSLFLQLRDSFRSTARGLSTCRRV